MTELFFAEDVLRAVAPTEPFDNSMFTQYHVDLRDACLDNTYNGWLITRGTSYRSPMLHVREWVAVHDTHGRVYATEVGGRRGACGETREALEHFSLHCGALYVRTDHVMPAATSK